MTYNELVQKIVDLEQIGLEIFNVGKSVLGKNILATHVGSYDGTQIIIQGAIHAREYITSLLMIEQAKYLQTSGLVTEGGIYFIFITNPDGVKLVLDGLESSAPCEITRQYLRLGNNNNDDFLSFKANINLVDLNTNFDALWGQGGQNVNCPNAENFTGFFPNSERETQSLIDITLKNRPALTISYHSKGEVIYYGFEGESSANIERDRLIGEALSAETGYPLIFTENSTGGYKDWCIDKLQIPAYTIEVGNDSLPHPIGEENLPEIVDQNLKVPEIALSLAIEQQNVIQSSYKDCYGFDARSNERGTKSLFEKRSAGWRSHRS